MSGVVSSGPAGAPSQKSCYLLGQLLANGLGCFWRVLDAVPCPGWQVSQRSVCVDKLRSLAQVSAFLDKGFAYGSHVGSHLHTSCFEKGTEQMQRRLVGDCWCHLSTRFIMLLAASLGSSPFRTLLRPPWMSLKMCSGVWERRFSAASIMSRIFAPGKVIPCAPRSRLSLSGRGTFSPLIFESPTRITLSCVFICSSVPFATSFCCGFQLLLFWGRFLCLRPAVFGPDPRCTGGVVAAFLCFGSLAPGTSSWSSLFKLHVCFGCASVSRFTFISARHFSASFLLSLSFIVSVSAFLLAVFSSSRASLNSASICFLA